MKIALAAVLSGLVATALTLVPDAEGVRNVARDDIALEARQAPTGECCTAGKSVKQDQCTTPTGTAGKCVPGNGVTDCHGALNCVANTQLACDNAVKEFSGVLCRCKLPGGKLADGKHHIHHLGQAKVG